MRFVPLASLTLSSLLLFACDTTCPAGKTRYGRKCVDRLAADAGDAGGGGSLEGGTDLDASAGEGDGDPDAALTECIPPTCDPCEAQPCLNDGVCSTTETAFECTCKVGFSGKTCEADVCELDPCEHGECTRKASGRTCKCEPGWEGDACETNTNASLAGLTVSAGQLYPAFKPNVFEYSVDLGISAPEILVTPTVAVPDGVVLKLDGLATESGQPSELYALELNTSKVVPIEVTADDGTKATYQVTVRRSLVQQAYVKRTSPAEAERLGGDTALQLGSAAAIEGDLMVIGAPLASRPGLVNGGSIVLFGRVDGNWSEVWADEGRSANAQLGWSVALSSRWVVAGAPYQDDGSGAVHIYERLPDGLSAPEILKAPPASVGGNFGNRVALSGNVLVVGAPLTKGSDATTEVGAAYVYRFEEEWSEPEPLAVPHSAYQFGHDVAVDGSMIAVGVPADRGSQNGGGADQTDPQSGAVLVYEIGAGEIVRIGYLKQMNAGCFGTAVGVSGGRVAAASGYQCPGGSQVVVFSRNQGGWMASPPFGPPTGLSVPDDLEPQGFAWSRLSFEGNRIMVGAYLESYGGGGVNPDRSKALPTIGASGAVFGFVQSQQGWQLDAYIKPSANTGDGYFGAAVALAGDTLVIAEPGDDSGNPPNEMDTSKSNSGAVYVFSTNCANVPAGASVPGC